ncbi:unnamed protein product [Adineta steineri]|uniref:Uncharacterized protein n=1 Tax=Adineta steineri TaxID=433720 RepID=A0A815B898_9BILA|nr:unnamed protein product [Adineta steineri]
MTNINNEHKQMISVLNQLIDEREILSRENEYLRSRETESLLIKTMNEMRKERNLLFKLLSNLITKHNYDEQEQHASIPIRFGLVRGASIASGTAIATFPNGKYSGHAAIYTGQNNDGIQVWDQWVGRPVATRTIRWNGSGISNNGDSFFVIV